jgi:hypothetical protein
MKQHFAAAAAEAAVGAKMQEALSALLCDAVEEASCSRTYTSRADLLTAAGRSKTKLTSYAASAPVGD